MYISGVVVGFILAFIIFMIQGTQRREENDSSIMSVIVGSAIASILSWLTVFLILTLLLTGRVAGISERNL